MEKRRSIWEIWLPLAIISTAIVGLVYGTQQQSYRVGADDPQIQIAGDIATALDSGRQLAPATSSVDASQSLSAFYIILDKSHKLISSNLTNDPVPLPPNGVFNDASKKGELRFTWETADGKRYATVVKPFKSGYVVSARSLQEVEKRENRLLWMCAAGLGVILVATFIVALVFR